MQLVNYLHRESTLGPALCRQKTLQTEIEKIYYFLSCYSPTGWIIKNFPIALQHGGF